MQFSEVYLPIIQDQLAAIGYSLTESKRLADAVKRLSDFYIENPEKQTPWNEKWAQAAYLSYFFPLNYLRIRRVLEQGEQASFWQNLNGLVDFGSGPGTFSLAANDSGTLKSFSKLHIENSRSAVDLHKQVLESLSNNSGPKPTWANSLESTGSIKKDSNVLVLSYSLTELKELPSWAFDFEAICIIEPSTRQDGRRLLEQRQKLIESGYSIWAPCTHQLQCPLLKESVNDWCHDRVHVELPIQLKKIENHLPMKNRTITLSYLMARRKSPMMATTNIARLTGDQLIEKGKARQLVCRKDTREFLAWLEREGKPKELFRGDLITLPTHLEEKPKELRFRKNLHPEFFS